MFGREFSCVRVFRVCLFISNAYMCVYVVCLLVRVYFVCGMYVCVRKIRVSSASACNMPKYMLDLD